MFADPLQRIISSILFKRTDDTLHMAVTDADSYLERLLLADEKLFKGKSCSWT
jgi:hypothetical protein